MEKWTDKELKLLKRYEQLSNDYNATPDIVKDSNKVEDILFMEASLLVCNKPVIAYEGNKPVGVFTFKEVCKERLVSKRIIFMYHPVNFSSMREYSGYLQN